MLQHLQGLFFTLEAGGKLTITEIHKLQAYLDVLNPPHSFVFCKRRIHDSLSVFPGAANTSKATIRRLPKKSMRFLGMRPAYQLELRVVLLTRRLWYQLRQDSALRLVGFVDLKLDPAVPGMGP